MFKDLRSCIEFFYKNFDALKTNSVLVLGTVKYEMKFDPNSYNQVLLFSYNKNGEEHLAFAATEFGLYIRDIEYKDISLYFYHTIVGSNIFGLGPVTLSKAFYMLTEMQK